MDVGSKGVNFCMAGASTSSGGKTGAWSYAGFFPLKYKALIVKLINGICNLFGV